MTKQQVLSGLEFKLRSSDTSTFKISPEGKFLVKTIYTYSGVKCLEDYTANINKIGTKTISFITFIIGKQVNVKLRYEDLLLAQPLVANGVVEI
jgi:hypothetical protein